VCCDSHTCTIGAFGTLAFAVGSSEVTTVLKRGALIIQRPQTLRITITGTLALMSTEDSRGGLYLHRKRPALSAVVDPQSSRPSIRCR
jgi:3-isopropylmalate/(R)-2-methylmalate dehydratase large subunit